jgi:metal-sulfur cluster biosynthetic enzyme
MKKMTKKLILKKLSEVLDPEINISIVDLGLIYKLEFQPDKKSITLTMTLTTMGCPLFDLIENEIQQKIKELGFNSKNIKIKLVFDPPWSVEKMTARGKAQIGI